MEEENSKRDTRQRSRSKTPLTLRSSVDREVDVDGEKKKVKKIPTVDTITEESSANTTASQRSTRTKRAVIVAKTIASDNNVRVIDLTDSPANQETAALIANSIAVVPSAISASEQTITKTTTITTSKSTKSSGELIASEKQQNQQTLSAASKLTTAAAATAAAAAAAATTRSASSREIIQNESNKLLERNTRLKTSTPRASNASSAYASFSSDVSITNGNNMDEHVPFKEYKEAGEYWNKYPKTDYTYSKLSQQRREIKPGVIAMPNMSRRSLEHHQERVNSMIRRDPAQESFFRSRYKAWTTLTNRKATDSYYDSQDEADFTYGRNGGSYISSDSQSFVRRLMTVITTFFSSSYYSVTSVFRRKQVDNIYYARFGEQQKGFFGRIWERISNTFVTIFSYIYLGISTILFLDSWLLQSSNASSGKKKGFLLGLLILMPLLLLGAWNLSDESDRISYRKRIPNLPTSLSSLPNIQATLDEFSSRTTKLVPIALALIKTQTSKVSDKMKFLFDFHWNWLPYTWNHQHHVAHNHITNNIQASLSAEEYNNVLQHINTYIETVVSEKIKNYEEMSKQQKQIDPMLVQHIANIVKEYIVQYNYVLTDSDIERIVEIVRVKIAVNGKKTAVPFVLSQDNLEEISKIVKQNIEIHRHEWTILSNNVEKAAETHAKLDLDVEEILYKILTSPKLHDVIDQRIVGATALLSTNINNQKNSIDQLNHEVNDIKLKLANILSANQKTQISLSNLKFGQDELSEGITMLQNQHNEKFVKLLNEIDLKLSAFGEKQYIAMDEHIRSVLVDILGYKSTDGKPLQNVDITNWIRNVFAAKELLETRLNELNSKFENKLNDEIQQSASILIKDISEKIKRDVVVMIAKNNEAIVASGVGDVNRNVSLNETRIRDIIKEALAVYDADKTGMVDYALETSGGQVLSTRCTENFQVKSAQLSIFGIPLWYKSNTPRTVISPAVQPGECWAFQGFPGFLVLKLNHNIFVTGFTMEHIPRSLSPNGKIDSAPKLFTVWGLETENDAEPFQFGEYEYLDNSTSLQYFAVRNTEYQNVRSHNIVELRIESNHGNTNYTCLYRFRVHGTITPTLS